MKQKIENEFLLKIKFIKIPSAKSYKTFHTLADTFWPAVYKRVF